MNTTKTHCSQSMADKETLALHIPSVEDMWFAQTLQQDPATMSYNAGWDVSYSGYHPDTGCIDLPRDQWDEKHARLVGREPDAFYAFVKEQKTGRFVCEINYHYTRDKNWWDMGVLVYAPYRGRGYGRRALELLLHRAFVVDGIDRLHNDFEDTRTAALTIHRRAGFRQVGTFELMRFGKPVRIIDLMLAREEYLAAHPVCR